MLCKEAYERKKKLAYYGFEIIEKMKEKYRLDIFDFCILFPHIEDDINRIGIKYLKQFVNYYCADKVIVVYISDSNLENMNTSIYDAKIYFENVNKTEMEALIELYATWKFSTNIFVMSLTLPDGRYGNKIMEGDGMPIDEIVALGIYEMNRYEVES